MGKTDIERQAKRREKIKQDIDKYKDYLAKDRIRKKLKRLQDKEKTNSEQEAFKASERLRVRNYRQKKKAIATNITLPSESPFQSRQSIGKALNRVKRALPNSPRKKIFVIAKMAAEAGIDVKRTLAKTVSKKKLSDENQKIIEDFYLRDAISWQAPGRKDRVILREIVNGKKEKNTLQIRYMLMSLKEAYELFKNDFQEIVIGLSKFCALRPIQVKLFEQIPHNVCVCQYHENVRLILNALEQHTNLIATFSGFVSQLTCNEESKDCIYRRCDTCKDSLDFFKPSDEVGQTMINYQQWQKPEKRAEKINLSATVNDVFNDLKNQTNEFLVHRFIKRLQQKHFAKLIEECDGSSAVLQVDFSENASIVNQNEIQSAHWSHKQVTIFTGHVWVNKNIKESFAIVSDDLEHTKEAIYAFMSVLLSIIKKNYSEIKVLNVFTDGPTSQFKQRYLFSNLHGWENEYGFKIIWNFFATSHGKGAVDGIGGTVKRSVWRNVRTTAVAPIDAEAYYELVKSLNLGITVTYVSSEAIKKKCFPRLEVWGNTLAVANTMKLHCIQVRNENQLEVAAFSNDEIFKVVSILKVIDSSDNEYESSSSDTTSNDIVINNGDWVLVVYENERFPGEVTDTAGSDYEVCVMHKSGKFWKWPKKEDKILYKRENIINRISPPVVAGTRGQFLFDEIVI